MFDSLCPDLVTLANHQDSELRDSGLATLGLLKGRVGDGVDKYTSKFNQQKLDKVSEAASEYKITKYDKSKKAKKAAPKKEEKKAEMSESEAMGFDAPKPKTKKKKAKGPPASFFKRQEEMKAKAEEKFEEIKADLKGTAPPPKKEKVEAKPAATSAPAARPQTAQPSNNRKIVVDDSGPGVAKEDAEPLISERCPSSILKKFEEAKWQDKVEGYGDFARWIVDQDYSNEVLEAGLWYVKMKQKEWKEKNVNLVKAALG